MTETEPSPFREIWVETPDGRSMCALINGDLGWLMYLRHPDGDAGFSSRNPAYSGPPDEMVVYRLDNGQEDEYPRAWEYPIEVIEGALEHFKTYGEPPSYVQWHNDSEDGTDVWGRRVSIPRLDEADCEILYAFPRIPTDLEGLFRNYMWYQRSGPPPYQQLRSTIAKATEAGLVTVSGNTYKLADEWFARLHGADMDPQRDEDAFPSFLRKYGDRELPLTAPSYHVPREVYERAVRSETRMFR